MTRYGMLINTKKCVGCSACRIACQMKNHLDPEESFIKYHEIETGEYPNVYNEIVPTPVSYTHLDVYKRQRRTSSRRCSRYLRRSWATPSASISPATSPRADGECQRCVRRARFLR